MNINKIEFNNFKAFGEKMQTFSKKPITLVYGPNSIGKSSFLHSQLLFESFVSNGSSKLLNNNFAGDNLDIGDFKNYVHMHDDKKSINYSLVIEKKDDILEYIFNKDFLIIQGLYENNFFSENISEAQIDEKLSSEYKNSGIKFSNLKESNDDLYKFIKFTNTLNIKNTIALFKACKYLVNINRINYSIVFQKDNITNIELYIDDDLYIDKNNKIDTNSLTYKHIKEVDCILTDNNLKSHLMTTSEEDYRTVQYFSPLRPYPTRKDMLQIDSIPSENNLKEFIYSLSETERNIIKFFSRQKYTLLRLPLFLYPKFFKLFYLQGSLNYFLSEENKVTLYGAFTSNQLWVKLINNRDLQQKISSWLSDTRKLKSTYRLIVEKTKINRLDTFQADWKSFVKNKPKDIVSKAIDSFGNMVEKVLLKVFKLKPLYLNELKFEDTRTNTEVTPREMGLGISQVMPILISVIDSKERKIYLEQPELHLHPKIQMDLADEFIRSYKENNNEFMIETHSEHLLLRIMKRMRDTVENKQDREKSLDLTPDDICLLYVDSDEDSTYIKELRLSPKGKLLDHWPNGFFEEGFKERFS